jgi:hypothetical protein|tara:strand:+ start:108 stop:326 length:219 start_codon:yes stop_codon:yes gene_type:complete
MCFGGSSPAPNPPPPPTPPPADLAPTAPRIGENGDVDNKRSQTNKKKKGTSALRIDQQVGGTSATGINIPKK